MEHSSKKN